MARNSLPKISVVGAGKVGSSLAMALFEQGYPIASVINRTGARAIALAKRVKCRKASTQIRDIDPASGVILIAVSDTSLQEVADEVGEVKRLRFKSLFIAHTSGIHIAGVLGSAQKKGALVASMHPIQTFPEGPRPARLKGIVFGIEGSPAALSKAEHLVKSLGARSVTVSAELKPIYHVACVFASSSMIAVLNSVSEISGLLKLGAHWTEVFGPLMTSAMENTIRTSAVRALSGPVVRGDVATISSHLKALSQQAPQLLPLYTVTGIDVARLAVQRGKIKITDYDAMRSLFTDFIKSIPVIARKTS